MKRLAFVWLVIGLVPVEVGLASERLAVIVSDLHLDEREDRGPRDGFSRLVAELQERSGDNAELVLNGDAFELAGRDEGDAVVSLDRILAAHPWFGKLLSVFSVRGANRVVFVPGDRDAALLFPAVAARLRERVGAEVATSGIWTSVDGRVVAEHGHQLPDDAYRFEHWPRPFTQNGRLDTSWGERELEPLYELLEQRFPVIRDFATRLSGLKVGLSAANEVPSSELLKLFLTHVSWQQFRRDLELEVRPPEWNLTATRTLGNNFLLHSLPTDDTLYEVWRDAVEQGRLSASDLTDAEVRLVCNYRAAVRRARRRMERGLTQLVRVGPVVAECPRSESSRGPSFSYYWSSRDARYEQHLANISSSFKRTPDVFVHGHTHLPDRGFVPLGDEDDEASGIPLILDTGAFKRVVTPARFKAIRQEEGATTVEALERLRFDRLSECYSFVLVEPSKRDEEVSTARLWYWNREADGTWEMSTRCES